MSAGARAADVSSVSMRCSRGCAPPRPCRDFPDETRNDARGKDLAAVAERAGVKLMRVPTKRWMAFYGGARHQGRGGAHRDEALEAQPR